MKNFAVFLVLLVALPALAQNQRVDRVVQARSGLPAPGAFVAVCNQPADTSTTPCSPLAPICSSLTDATCSQSNPVQADGLGNIGFYTLLGCHTYQFYGTGLTTTVKVDQDCNSGGGGGGGGTGGHIIQNNGSDMPARTHLNFHGGGFSLTDNGVTSTTDMLIGTWGNAAFINWLDSLGVSNGYLELDGTNAFDILGHPSAKLIQFKPDPSGSTTFSLSATQATLAANIPLVMSGLPLWTGVAAGGPTLPGAGISEFTLCADGAWCGSHGNDAFADYIRNRGTITTGTAYSNATTTFSDVKGSTGQTLSFPVLASTSYNATCWVMWQGSANTAGPKFQWTGPASPTNVMASMFSPVTATTFITAAAVAFSSSMANTGTVTATTNFVAELTLGLVNGVNAGTVTLQAAANGVGTLTIQDGSFCRVVP